MWIKFLIILSWLDLIRLVGSGVLDSYPSYQAFQTGRFINVCVSRFIISYYPTRTAEISDHAR